MSDFRLYSFPQLQTNFPSAVLTALGEDSVDSYINTGAEYKTLLWSAACRKMSETNQGNNEQR